jgi:hypothetical protein
MRRIIVVWLVLLISGCAGSKPASKAAREPLAFSQDVARALFHLTPEQDQAAKTAVIALLKDPESARFSGVAGVGDPAGTYSVCGSVNAKNSYGGYVGSVLFAVDKGRAMLWDKRNKGAAAIDNELILMFCKPNR